MSKTADADECLTIHEKFKKAVLKFGNEIAIICEENNEKLTYNQLDERSNSLAAILLHKLRKVNIFEPTYISVMTERRISMVVALLAVLKSGAAYVPVDPVFPSARQSHIFSHSRSTLLIVDDETLPKAKILGDDLPPVILIDSKDGTVVKSKSDSGSYENLDHSLSLDYTSSYEMYHKDQKMHQQNVGIESVDNNVKSAYVLYTSGSTGKPKGVLVSHEGVINLLEWFANELCINSKSIVLGLTTFCFDISVLEIFLPLLSGGKLIIASSVTQKDPYRIIDLIDTMNITVMQATPTTFEMMLATGWTGDNNIDFLVGGEAFRPSLAALIQKSKSLRNVYGPTETTIWSSCFNFKDFIMEPKNISSTSFVVPVGLPISQTEFYVVIIDNDNASKQGEGQGQQEKENQPYRLANDYEEEGELWIGGIGVAVGYLHAPELTAERFLKNPFGSGRVYRTGDLVKRRITDGNYIFIRRLDDQVKINGYRIELAEIEITFSNYPGIEQTVVIVRNSQLIAYIKIKKGIVSMEGQLSPEELNHLKSFAAQSLTSYMLPSHIICVDSFPLTDNGKLNRNALPDPPLAIISREEEEEQEEEDEDIGNVPAGADNETPDVNHNCLPTTGGILTSTTEQSLMTNTSDTSTTANYPALPYSMTDHVCNVIYNLRGYKPKLNSSFATIGIDSLGSILFLRALSDSLGGFRLDVKSVYSAGVTIRSFSDKLFETMKEKSPEVLTRLKIMQGSPTPSIRRRLLRLEEGTENSYSYHNGGNQLTSSHNGIIFGKGELKLEEEKEEGNIDDDEEEDELSSDTFGETVLANRKLFEGVRGALTLMVLWDHFHGVSLHPIPATWVADTSMFVILSGFTTSLQLRSTIEVNTVSDTKKVWDWKSFLFSRFVGVFPILWLALLFNAPRWYYWDLRQQQTGQMPLPSQKDIFGREAVEPRTEGLCTIMYLIGMQQWVRDTCAKLGPYDVYYAGVIWNCFLFYAVFRVGFDFLQKKFRYHFALYTLVTPETLDDTTLVKDKEEKPPVYLTGGNYPPSTPLTLVTPYMNPLLKNRRVVKNKVNAILDLFENKSSIGMLTMWTILWILIFAFLFTVVKAKGSFIVYFFFGVVGASIVENIFRVLPIMAAASTSSLITIRCHRVFYSLFTLIGRYFPDVIIIIIGFLMSIPRKSSYNNSGRFYLLPYLIMVYVSLCVLQSDKIRGGISRKLLESSVMTLIGYSSFPIYLFQQVLMNFYARIIYDDIENHVFPIGKGGTSPTNDYYYSTWWLANKPLWWKAIGLVCLIGFCYLIQKYYQDGLIAWMTTKFLNWSRNRRKFCWRNINSLS